MISCNPALLPKETPSCSFLVNRITLLQKFSNDFYEFLETWMNLILWLTMTLWIHLEWQPSCNVSAFRQAFKELEGTSETLQWSNNRICDFCGCLWLCLLAAVNEEWAFEWSTDCVFCLYPECIFLKKGGSIDCHFGESMIIFLQSYTTKSSVELFFFLLFPQVLLKLLMCCIKS